MSSLQGRPRSTDTAWHMGQVQDHQSVLVCTGTLQAHALSAGRAGDVLAVHADIDRATGGADEASPACSRTIDIAHVAIGRVRVLEDISMHVHTSQAYRTHRKEVELVKESPIVAVVVLQRIRGCTEVGEKAQTWKKRGKDVHCSRMLYMQLKRLLRSVKDEQRSYSASQRSQSRRE